MPADRRIAGTLIVIGAAVVAVLILTRLLKIEILPAKAPLTTGAAVVSVAPPVGVGGEVIGADRLVPPEQPGNHVINVRVQNFQGQPLPGVTVKVTPASEREIEPGPGALDVQEVGEPAGAFALKSWRDPDA